MDCREIAVVVMSVTIISSLPVVAGAQSANMSELRTAWGDPNITGVLNNSTLTPFQRPEELADQEFY